MISAPVSHLCDVTHVNSCDATQAHRTFLSNSLPALRLESDTTLKILHTGRCETANLHTVPHTLTAIDPRANPGVGQAGFSPHTEINFPFVRSVSIHLFPFITCYLLGPTAYIYEVCVSSHHLPLGCFNPRA